MTSADIVIVGAGIVGAACAAALAADRHSVLVIDGNAVASGTTAAGMGHIVAMDDSEAQLALTDYSRRLWNERAADLPVECEYEHCGTIWVAADGDEMAEARRKQAFYRDRGIDTEIVGEQELRELEPELRDGLAGGLLVPGDSVIYQPRAAAALIASAKDSGARLVIGTKVATIGADGVTLGDGTRIAAETVVIAAGLGSNELVAGLGIRRKKGHLVVTERYPGFVRHQLVELGYLKSAHSAHSDSVAFNVQPRITGQMLVGSSRQFDIESGAIDHSILGKMMRRAIDFLPRLERLAAVRAWTGFRPATADNLPLIGRHPTRRNVFLATGHEGLGITTATGTAAIVADLIAGRTPAIDPAPYDPARLLEV